MYFGESVINDESLYIGGVFREFEIAYNNDKFIYSLYEAEGDKKSFGRKILDFLKAQLTKLVDLFKKVKSWILEKIFKKKTKSVENTEIVDTAKTKEEAQKKAEELRKYNHTRAADNYYKDKDNERNYNNRRDTITEPRVSSDSTATTTSDSKSNEAIFVSNGDTMNLTNFDAVATSIGKLDEFGSLDITSFHNKSREEGKELLFKSFRIPGYYVRDYKEFDEAIGGYTDKAIENNSKKYHILDVKNNLEKFNHALQVTFLTKNLLDNLQKCINNTKKHIDHLERSINIMINNNDSENIAIQNQIDNVQDQSDTLKEYMMVQEKLLKWFTELTTKIVEQDNRARKEIENHLVYV